MPMTNTDEAWKAKETDKVYKSFQEARDSYSKPFDENGLTEGDKLFGFDPYCLEGSEKKVEGSVNVADLGESKQNVVEKFNNLIKRKFETEEFVKAQKGFVYFIRNQDLYKIGITQNLLRRLNQLNTNEVLDVVRCSNFKELEKELHIKFSDTRTPQKEYFRLTQTQIEVVHQLIIKEANF